MEFALVAPMLFILLIGIVEAGRFILNLETLNNATREGARYAVVHGARSLCPTGPMPEKWEENKVCKEPGQALEPYDGANVQKVVKDRAVGLAAEGDLDVPVPIWTYAEDPLPSGPEASPQADNFRGNYVTVYARYEYEPIIKSMFGIGIVPTIAIDAESSLVINN